VERPHAGDDHRHDEHDRDEGGRPDVGLDDDEPREERDRPERRQEPVAESGDAGGIGGEMAADEDGPRQLGQLGGLEIPPPRVQPSAGAVDLAADAGDQDEDEQDERRAEEDRAGPR
jgi:hypothetical protein